MTETEQKMIDMANARLYQEGKDLLKPPVDIRPVRVQILHEGAFLTNGERDAEYGPPAINLAASGELKAVFRRHIVRAISPAELEAIDMVLTKLGRIATGLSPKRDTYVDAAAYIAIAGEIALTSKGGGT